MWWGAAGTTAGLCRDQHQTQHLSTEIKPWSSGGPGTGARAHHSVPQEAQHWLWACESERIFHTLGPSAPIGTLGFDGPGLSENLISRGPAPEQVHGVALAKPANGPARTSLSLRSSRRRRRGAPSLPAPHCHGGRRRRRLSPSRRGTALRRVLAALHQTAGRGHRPGPGEFYRRRPPPAAPSAPGLPSAPQGSPPCRSLTPVYPVPLEPW